MLIPEYSPNGMLMLMMGGMVFSLIIMLLGHQQEQDAKVRQQMAKSSEDMAKTAAALENTALEMEFTRRETRVGWFAPEGMGRDMADMILMEREDMLSWDERFCRTVMPTIDPRLCVGQMATKANEVYWHAVQDAAFARKAEAGELRGYDAQDWEMVKWRLKQAIKWFKREKTVMVETDDYDELVSDSATVLARIKVLEPIVITENPMEGYTLPPSKIVR